jgi:hypothetical protein
MVFAQRSVWWPQMPSSESPSSWSSAPASIQSPTIAGRSWTSSLRSGCAMSGVSPRERSAKMVSWMAGGTTATGISSSTVDAPPRVGSSSVRSVTWRDEKSTSAPASTVSAIPASSRRRLSSAASGRTRDETFSYTPSIRCGVATDTVMPSSAMRRHSATLASQSRGPSSMPGSRCE